MLIHNLSSRIGSNKVHEIKLVLLRFFEKDNHHVTITELFVKPNFWNFRKQMQS